MILIRKGTPFQLEKCSKDDTGRYLLIQGHLRGRRIAIMTTYGPNTDDPDFYTHVWTKLNDVIDRPIIWGGDLNLTLDDKLDRSGHTREPHKRAAAKLGDIMAQCKLADIWRLLHPRHKEATHVSAQHNSWTRIDYWLASTDIITWVKEVQHLPKTLSDHSPILLKLDIPDYAPPPFDWRFNAKALSDPIYRSTINKAIEEYLAINKPTTEDPCLLWEALKATIRGICISTSAGILKDIRHQLHKRETRLQALEREYAQTKEAQILGTIRTVMNEFQEYAEDELRYLSHAHRARAYGEAGRPGHTLAAKICAQHRPHTVLTIKDTNGNIHHDTKHIVQAFRNTYEHLYKSRLKIDTTELNTYLEDISLAWLSNEHREALALPITVEEIAATIKSLPNGKAPGPDGFTAEFYKAFVDQLAPVLVEMYGSAYEQRMLPPTLREAMLIALLKPNKAADDCESYRPLSLLNTDTKILAKTLAGRLGKIMPFLILPDQTGFIQGRSTAQNTRTLFALAHYLTPQTRAAAILLDAAKAFDSIEWAYMRAILQRMGFPPIFIQWITILYTFPTARVKVNKYISDNIEITRGTRQGGPLSPLLFALALEPLACKVRQGHHYSALQFPQRPLHIALYADDMVLYVRDPETNLSPLIREFIKFSGFAGLQINWSKSCIVPLTDSTTPHTTEYPLEWQQGAVRYLGVWFHRDPEVVLRENYGRAIVQLEEKIGRWIQLPLSLADRVAIVKMVVLPKLLYLFNNIPIALPVSIRKRIDSMVLRLIWAGKQARIKLQALTLPYSRGGYQVPNFWLYYLCAQAQYAHHWYHPTLYLPHSRRRGRCPSYTTHNCSIT